MFLAGQIDTVARRRQGAGERAPELVTPAVVRFYHRQASDLRAEAQAVALQSLLRAALAAIGSLLPSRRASRAAQPPR